MTVYGLAAAVVWAATAAFVILRAEKFGNRWLDLFVTNHQPNRPLEIPDDLEALVLSEEGPTEDSTEMIRTQLREAIKERWATYRDWNKVRLAFGLGTIDEPKAVKLA